MKVDFIVRSDHVEKFGGDRLQVEHYCRHLEAAGVSTRVIPYVVAPRVRPGALVHIVNLDRPYDFLDAVAAAPGPYVVSPIHHRLSDVRLMRQAEEGQGLRTLVGRLPEQMRELAAYGARSLRPAGPSAAVRGLWTAARRAPRLWRRVVRALDAAGTVLVLAQGERRDIMDDTGWRGDNYRVVPNGLPDHRDVEGLPWSDRDPGLLVVGRVEPRKRQLDVAKAAAELGVPTTFVGELTRSAPRYAEEFRRLVDRSGSLTYTGRLDPDEVVRLMGRHRVLLNMSWVEVQSLVDLEAAAMGCYVVASPAGHSAEWLPHHVTTVDRFDVAGAVRQARHLATLDAGPPPFEYQFSWEDAARGLLDTYSALQPWDV